VTRVAFLFDPGNADGSIGGAELSMAEFAAAAPEGVEVGMDADGLKDAEVVVVGNCVSYAADTVEGLRGKRVIRYFHDLDPHSHPDLRTWLLANATCIFTSPLHVERFPFEVSDPTIIPPALDLEAFRPSRQMKRNTERVGTCWLGSMANAGKGVQLAGEFAEAEGISIDFYGEGPYGPGQTAWTRPCGAIPHGKVAEVLASYETFVHLPTDVEPFGRAVVEAWAAGAKLIVNRNIGALHFIENDQDALRTAGEDFWQTVLT